MDMQDPIDATMFSQGSFDAYRFSNGLPQDDLVHTPGGMPAVGSVDSNLGNDGMDFLNQGENSYQHERRSSSEEKESLTPAQSRRKAQNRAAYVSTLL
jgi:AP-1-like factor